MSTIDRIVIEGAAMHNGGGGGPRTSRQAASTSGVPEQKPTNTADVLQKMADTFRERNAVYGSNFEMVGPIMRILFPAGIPVELLGSDQFHLFELVIVKLSRLAIAQLTHIDSAHDAAVYCAMIESIIRNENV